jgi:hypothetical protein
MSTPCPVESVRITASRPRPAVFTASLTPADMTAALAACRATAVVSVIGD